MCLTHRSPPPFAKGKPMSDLLIRPARPADADALLRLAALDSRHVPAGELVLAEVGGEIVAAHSSAGTIADPFRPTADVVELLRLRSRSGAGKPARRRLARAHLRFA